MQLMMEARSFTVGITRRRFTNGIKSMRRHKLLFLSWRRKILLTIGPKTAKERADWVESFDITIFPDLHYHLIRSPQIQYTRVRTVSIPSFSMPPFPILGTLLSRIQTEDRQTGIPTESWRSEGRLLYMNDDTYYYILHA